MDSTNIPPDNMMRDGSHSPRDNDSQLVDRYSKVLDEVVNLKVFLASAPNNFGPNDIMQRYHLPDDEIISCICWNKVFYITGTDIVRCLSYRFKAFGRKIFNRKKFEEGIFSDLRALKCNSHAILEEPKSEFLAFLHKHNCVRTQKKQKVFHWFEVSHDNLFLDALERDLKREASGKKASTEIVGEPAMSFRYDSSQSLVDQLAQTIDGIPKPLAAIADVSTSDVAVGQYWSEPHDIATDITDNSMRKRDNSVMNMMLPAGTGMAMPMNSVAVHSSMPYYQIHNAGEDLAHSMSMTSAAKFVHVANYEDPVSVGQLNITSGPPSGKDESVYGKPDVDSDFPLDYFPDDNLGGIGPGGTTNGANGGPGMRYGSYTDDGAMNNNADYSHQMMIGGNRNYSNMEENQRGLYEYSSRGYDEMNTKDSGGYPSSFRTGRGRSETLIGSTQGMNNGYSLAEYDDMHPPNGGARTARSSVRALGPMADKNRVSKPNNVQRMYEHDSGSKMVANQREANYLSGLGNQASDPKHYYLTPSDSGSSNELFINEPGDLPMSTQYVYVDGDQGDWAGM